MEEQKNRSRAGSKMTGDVFTDAGINLDVPKTEFLGYSALEGEGKILKVLAQEPQPIMVNTQKRIAICELVTVNIR